MADLIVTQDVQTLVAGWLQAEQEGNRFPVPFDFAWQIAGYSKKSNAKRKLAAIGSGLIQGQDYDVLISEQWTNDGRSSDQILLTTDAFKQFCLMAKTEEGKATRLYFIEAEKKWKLVQQHAPQVAEEIEILKLKAEIAQQEAMKSQADEKTLSLRHYVVTALPEPVQQKILGYTEIKTVEYRDRVIHSEEMIRDGSTINKTEMCRELGLVTRSGGPDYKRLNAILLRMELQPSDWRLTASLRENEELTREAWFGVKQLWLKDERQRSIGE